MAILENIVLITFVTLCVLVLKGHGQNDCVPQAVHNLTISSNRTLWWEVDPNEPCEITSFKLDIEGDRDDNFHFTVGGFSKDLSFLEVCELWEFTVTPISHETVGYLRRLTAHIPLPPDADLSLDFFKYSFYPDFRLEWDLSNQTHGDCTLEYRVALEDQLTGTIEDVYVEGKTAHLDIAAPCGQYQISLRAVNIAHPIIEGPLRTLNVHFPVKPQRPPILKSVDASFIYFNTTWELHGDGNRCPLRYFHMDGDYFSITEPLKDLEDRTQVTIHVDSLKPNSMYHFQAHVENSGGWSGPTHVAVQTLPLALAAGDNN